MRPCGLSADRKTGRAITTYGDAPDLLEYVLRANYVGAELLLRQRGHALVIVTVAREFVTLVDDPPDDVRKLLGNPSQREERALGIRTVIEREQPVDVAFDARHLGGRRDLEIVLDIAGHGVGQSAADKPVLECLEAQSWGRWRRLTLAYHGLRDCGHFREILKNSRAWYST